MSVPRIHAPEGNFFLDTEDKACLIDFHGVALLPESFGNYLMRRKFPFVWKAAECLDRNATPMSKAREPLQAITGDRTPAMFICT